MKTFLGLVFCLIFFFCSFAIAEEYRALSIPWSGYWWPYNHGGIGTGNDYRGHPAPLEKYNLLASGIFSGGALDEYLETYYKPTAPYWNGLCAYWARAACYENGSIYPSSEENVIFRVGDKKGLLTFAHNRDVNALADGTRPEEFHFWLLNYIRDQRKAFVADLDPTTQVWSYPVYQYEMNTNRVGNTESVDVIVYCADDSVKPDYMGTQVFTKRYYYNLFLDADGAVTGGQWTGTSNGDHPELLSFPLGVGDIFSGLDYQEVVRLARSSDDFLEQGDKSVDITPGTYNLILLDDDVYTIQSQPGAPLIISIEQQPGSSKDIEMVITDADNVTVRQAVIEEDSPYSDMFALDNPPYTIHLTQDGYDDPNIYTLKMNLKKPFTQEIPYIPKANEWSGFALTNPGNEAVDNVLLTTRDSEGSPLQTVLGPLTIDPGEKRLFFFGDLPVRLTEMYKTGGLTLAADGPLELLNLIGNDDRFLATIVQGDARGSHLVIPDTVAPMTPGSNFIGGVRNETFEDVEVTLRLYSADGLLQKTVEETIPADEWLPISSGQAPFYSMPASGWIDVQAGWMKTLSGFQYLKNASGVETLFAIPLSGSTQKIVPHIPRSDYWKTSVTLINPQNADNTVIFHPALAGSDSSRDYTMVLAPHEKRTLEVQDLFAAGEGDPLYHSVLEINSHYFLTGYYTYSRPGGNDNASYPLLDEKDFKNELHLPHYAGGSAGSWWTGVVICNPSKISETVNIAPYDDAGNLMENAVQSVDLNAGAYDVFTVKSRFGESASAISFITFRTEADGAIGGFYLYGNYGHTNILSGANM